MAEELHSLPHILLVGDEQPHDEPLHDDQLHEEEPQLHDELLQHEPGDRQEADQDGQGHGGGLSGHKGSCSHNRV